MIAFPAYADRFELHPQRGTAFQRLSALFSKLARVDFSLSVDDPTVNQGQMASDFDSRLEQALHSLGAAPHSITLPPDVPQELDFAFLFDGSTVAVEIEKTNREKILRDLLKCHMYLSSGSDFAVIGLPRNYPHTHGIWDLFEFGRQRYDECRRYGFGTPDKLGRIILLGFTQYDARTGIPLSRATRLAMRKTAADSPPPPGGTAD